jgi:hypothetical protein
MKTPLLPVPLTVALSFQRQPAHREPRRLIGVPQCIPQEGDLHAEPAGPGSTANAAAFAARLPPRPRRKPLAAARSPWMARRQRPLTNLPAAL